MNKSIQTGHKVGAKTLCAQLTLCLKRSNGLGTKKLCAYFVPSFVPQKTQTAQGFLGLGTKGTNIILGIIKVKNIGICIT